MAFEHQPGRRITITTTGAKTNGQLTRFGNTVGVALTAAASGVTCEHAVEGVFRVAKKAGAGTSIAQGARAYTMVTGGVVKVTGALATGQVQMGTAWAAAATGDDTALVKLLGNAG